MYILRFRYPLIAQSLAVFAVQCLLASCTTEDDLAATLAGGVDPDTGTCVVNTLVGSTDYLSWSAPMEREDGTCIELTELGGFRVYYGTVEGYYTGLIDIDYITGTQIGSVPAVPGKYYFVITTYDTDGLESTYSMAVPVTL